ncbi:hypothetical protein ES706_01899 [subsurface metagenome]
MLFLKKISGNTFNLSIYVKPNFKEQKIIQENDTLIILLKSPPIKGKANKELLKLIKKKIDISHINVCLLSGFQNRYKVIQITFNNEIINEQFILEKLIK